MSKKESAKKASINKTKATTQKKVDTRKRSAEKGIADYKGARGTKGITKPPKTNNNKNKK